MDNEVMELIDELYSMVSEAWGVPLGNDKCIVERDKVLNMIEDIKAQLPVELSEAKRLVSARDEFIGNAKKEAESIRRTAEEKARALVDQQEIVRIARTRSSELMANAENKSRELRHVASDYVDDILRRSEESLAAALNEVRGSRSQFRTATGTPDAQSPQQKSWASIASSHQLLTFWRPSSRMGAKFCAFMVESALRRPGARFFCAKIY